MTRSLLALNTTLLQALLPTQFWKFTPSIPPTKLWLLQSFRPKCMAETCLLISKVTLRKNFQLITLLTLFNSKTLGMRLPKMATRLYACTTTKIRKLGIQVAANCLLNWKEISGAALTHFKEKSLLYPTTLRLIKSLKKQSKQLRMLLITLERLEPSLEFFHSWWTFPWLELSFSPFEQDI